MDETNNAAQAYDEMNEPFLPDGWEPGEDIFSTGDDAALSADGPGADAEPSTENVAPESGQTETVADAPTLGEQAAETDADSEGQQAGEETPGPAADETRETAAPSPRILKLRVDREDRDFDVTAATDEELSDLIQKGIAWNNRAESDKKAEYRRIYQKAVDSGYEEYMAKAAAAHAVGGVDYPLTDETEPAPPMQTAQQPPQQTPDFAGEFAALRAELAELKASISDKDGTIAALRRDKARLEQQRDAAQKAPVRSVTGGGATQKPESALDAAFMKGFDRD